ncbi:MAG: hypothetical protein GXP34_12155 [Actinobacteria bacterium]|nr:hypothetical protein [Actinomycetota bacterium]
MIDSTCDFPQEIVVISPSSQRSVTYPAPRVASGQMTSIPVRVIDSKSSTTGLGFRTPEAARAAASGGDLAQVDDAAPDAVPKTKLFATALRIKTDDRTRRRSGGSCPPGPNACKGPGHRCGSNRRHRCKP